MTLTPPLIALAAGKRVRPRKERVPAPKELYLHMPVAKLLREYAKPGWLWTHFPAGEKRTLLTAAKLKQMGLNAGWPDFLLISPRTASVHCLELKRLGADLTPAQAEFRIQCVANGIPYVVAYTMDQVLQAFDGWACLRVKIPARRADG